MRIIGGQFKSRLISMPKGVDMRPTQDKVRQAVFNVLSDVNGKKVLDLFAGSGAFGIESISRGASHVTFVENNPKCLSAIRLNLESLGIPYSCFDIIRSDADKAVSALSGSRQSFDIIFMDPPYYRELAKKSLITIDDYDILTRNGLVVVEHFKKDALASDLKTLTPVKERRYGDTVITIYGKKADV